MSIIDEIIPAGSVLEAGSDEIQKSTSSTSIFLGKKLPYEDAAYDAVVSCNILHKADHPESIIRDSCRVAKSFVAHVLPSDWKSISELRLAFPDMVIMQISPDETLLYKGEPAATVSSNLSRHNLEKGKVAYHKHDGYPEHPVAVKHHSQYFGSFAQNVISNSGYHQQIEELKQSSSLLKDYQISSLKQYKGYLSSAINNYLRTGKTRLGENEDAIKPLIAAIDESFSQIPPLKRDIVVYRGIPRDYLHEYKKPFTYQSYMSTSLDKEKASMHGGFSIAVLVPKGSRVLWLDFIENIFGYSSSEKKHLREDEILLPRGAEFDVLRGEDGIIELVMKSQDVADIEKSNLSPKKVQVHRGGKTFWAIRWVAPEQTGEDVDESQVANKPEWDDVEVYDKPLTHWPPDQIWYSLGMERYDTSDWSDHKRNWRGNFWDDKDRQAAIDYVLAHKFGNDVLEKLQDAKQKELHYFNTRVDLLPPAFSDVGDEPLTKDAPFPLQLQVHMKMPESHMTSSIQVDVLPDEVDIWDGDDLSAFDEFGENGEEIQQAIFGNVQRVYQILYGEPDYSKWKSEVGYFPGIIAEKMGKAPKMLTVYRDMSPVEYEKWQQGEEVPKGKYFATERRYARGSDIDYPKDSQVYSFKIPDNLLVPDGSGGWQLKQGAKFNPDDRIIKAQPPRSGLVPKSGDYEHPYRWIRPQEEPPSRFRKLPKDIQNVISKAFTHLTEEEAKKALRDTDGQVLDFQMNKRMTATVALFSPSSKTISLHPSLFSPSIQEKLRKAYPGIKADALDVVLVHEIGHSIMESMMKEESRKGSEYSDASLFNYSMEKAFNAVEAKKIKPITSYAKTDFAEFFAECFTYYVFSPKKLALLYPDFYAEMNKDFKRYPTADLQKSDEAIGDGAWWFETEEGSRKLLGELAEKQLHKSDLPLSAKALIANSEGKLLVLQNHPGKFEYDLPGGHVNDKEDDVQDALRREIKEETGLEVEDIEPFDCSGDTKIGLDNHPVLFYIVFADGEVKVSKEHAGFVWVSESDIDSMNLGAFEVSIRDYFASQDVLEKRGV